MSQIRGSFGVNLAQGVQLYDNRVTRVDLKSVVFVHLLKLAWVLPVALHHGHYHAHRGRDLSEEDRGLIFQALGECDLAHVLRELVFKPKTKSGHVLLWESTWQVILCVLIFKLDTNVFSEFLIRGSLNVCKPVSLVLSDLLEAQLVHIVIQDQNWRGVRSCGLERLHKWVS